MLLFCFSVQQLLVVWSHKDLIFHPEGPDSPKYGQ